MSNFQLSRSAGRSRALYADNKILTALVSEDGLAHRARPHPEARAKLTGLRMAGQMLPKATLVDVVLPAHWTRVVGGPSLR